MGLIKGPSTSENREKINNLIDRVEELEQQNETLKNVMRPNFDFYNLPLLDSFQSNLTHGEVRELEEPHAAYKATRNCIVRLVIPEGATVVKPYESAMGTSEVNKMRTDEAIVYDLHDGEQAVEYRDWPTSTSHVTMDVNAGNSFAQARDCSIHRVSFKYNIGDVVTPAGELDTDVYEDCESGIHFFASKSEAGLWYAN